MLYTKFQGHRSICSGEEDFVMFLPYMGMAPWGGRVVRRCWVILQCRGVLLTWIIVGQGPIVLAVGAGGVVWTFLLSSILTIFFLPLCGRRPDID